MLEDQIKVYVEDATSTAQLPSTVLGFEAAAVWVIRPGAIAIDEIERVTRAKVRQ